MAIRISKTRKFFCGWAKSYNKFVPGSRLTYWFAAFTALIVVLAWTFSSALHYFMVRNHILAPSSVADVLRKYGPATEREFAGKSRSIGVQWPPKRLYVLVFKQEANLELWIANNTGPYRFLSRYPILRMSGKLGPKRKEGDKQVPEGFYKISELNPNSRYHLSLKVNYPNAEDIRNSKLPVNKLGGDIFIHGSNVSIGCVAIGDDAIEKVFCLTAIVPSAYRDVLISPIDFRRKGARITLGEQSVGKLYDRLALKLRDF